MVPPPVRSLGPSVGMHQLGKVHASPTREGEEDQEGQLGELLLVEWKPLLPRMTVLAGRVPEGRAGSGPAESGIFPRWN